MTRALRVEPERTAWVTQECQGAVVGPMAGPTSTRCCATSV